MRKYHKGSTPPQISLGTSSKSGAGFTLIELLVIIAVIGVLATVLLVLINPAGQMAKAQDSIRKSDIKQIANALNDYVAQTGKYPREGTCESSRGMKGGAWPIPGACPMTDIESIGKWSEASGYLLDELVNKYGILKHMPIDPINNTTYYYRYEPRLDTATSACTDPIIGCGIFWVGVRLKYVDDPSKIGKQAFRCSSTGDCGEVTYTNAAGGSSFDQAEIF